MTRLTMTFPKAVIAKAENWLMSRSIEYEVAPAKNPRTLKIIAEFPSTEMGRHRVEMFRKFSERIRKV